MTDSIERAINRLAKCWLCRHGNCSYAARPHTWMSFDALARVGRAAPTTEQGWRALAGEEPCACLCNRAPEENDNRVR